MRNEAKKRRVSGIKAERAREIAAFMRRRFPEVKEPGWITTPTHPHYWLDQRWKQYVFSPARLEAWEFLHPEAPRVHGVYFLWTRDMGLLYIGMSGDILYRLNQHYWARKIPFRFCSMIEVDMDIAPMIELAYICALEPPYNNLFGPVRWRGHQRMANLIERIWRQCRIRRQ